MKVTKNTLSGRSQNWHTRNWKSAIMTFDSLRVIDANYNLWFFFFLKFPSYFSTAKCTCHWILYEVNKHKPMIFTACRLVYSKLTLIVLVDSVVLLPPVFICHFHRQRQRMSWSSRHADFPFHPSNQITKSGTILSGFLGLFKGGKIELG